MADDAGAVACIVFLAFTIMFLLIAVLIQVCNEANAKQHYLC
jgi:hypothetical protein